MKKLTFEMYAQGQTWDVTIGYDHSLKLGGKVIGRVAWVKQNVCSAVTVDGKVEIQRRTLKEAGASLVLHYLQTTQLAQDNLQVGDKVMVQRGGGAPAGVKGCKRSVRGEVVEVCGIQVHVRLLQDDPLDTVGWNKRGQVGNWSRSVVEPVRAPDEEPLPRVAGAAHFLAWAREKGYRLCSHYQLKDGTYAWLPLDGMATASEEDVVKQYRERHLKRL